MSCEEVYARDDEIDDDDETFQQCESLGMVETHDSIDDVEFVEKILMPIVINDKETTTKVSICMYAYDIYVIV